MSEPVEPVIVGQFGGAKSPIRVTLAEHEGVRILDIRRFYKDRASLELKPTPKGITLAGENFHELMACLAEGFTKITAWLSGGAVSDQARRRGAHTQATMSLSRPKVSYVGWRGADFFDVENIGAVTEVKLNTQHLLAQELLKVGSAAEAGQLLAEVLAAFRAAAHAAAVDGEGRMVDLSLLESSWTVLLTQSLRRERKSA